VLCFFSWGGEGLSSIFDSATLTSVESNKPAPRYFLWVDGRIILWEAGGYFTTKKTAKDLQSFLKKG
jgi:hypothetical protein